MEPINDVVSHVGFDDTVDMSIYNEPILLITSHRKIVDLFIICTGAQQEQIQVLRVQKYGTNLYGNLFAIVLLFFNSYIFQYFKIK